MLSVACNLRHDSGNTCITSMLIYKVAAQQAAVNCCKLNHI